MYRTLKRPILAAALGASVSLPVCYYIIRHPLVDANSRVTSPQELVIGANIQSTTAQEEIIAASRKATAFKQTQQNQEHAGSIAGPGTTTSIPSISKSPRATIAMPTTTTTATTTQLSTPYTATFSVPMHCESCTSSISSALSSLPGLQTTTFSLPDKIVTITGTTPPSAIITAIQCTNRPAILRGTGRPNSAAVCILETPPPPTPPAIPQPSPVRGLARLVELDENLTMLDLTLTGMAPGRYKASVREMGDISRGIESVGEVWSGFEGGKRGVLGEMEVGDGSGGRGGIIAELMGWRVWELVGRGVVVERVGRKNEGTGETNGERDGDGDIGGDGIVLGVVARSAGVWENEKVVCGCSGKTVWEEREEMVGRGML